MLADVEYAVLSESFDHMIKAHDVSVDLFGEFTLTIQYIRDSTSDVTPRATHLFAIMLRHWLSSTRLHLFNNVQNDYADKFRFSLNGCVVDKIDKIETFSGPCHYDSAISDTLNWSIVPARNNTKRHKFSDSPFQHISRYMYHELCIFIIL